MGTSTDHTGGRGGAWTPLKHAATSLTRGLQADRPDRVREGARRVVARHVTALGGADNAAATARAARTGVQRLGALLDGLGRGDLAGALEALGLVGLAGFTRYEVLDELVTFIAGDGADLDGAAARDAACEVLDTLFADAESWEELDITARSAVAAEGLVELLESFLAHYVYNRIPVVAERLSRLVDVEAIRRADEMMRQVILDVVQVALPPDPFTVDWAGNEGREIAADAVATSYRMLEDLDNS